MASPAWGAPVDSAEMDPAIREAAARRDVDLLTLEDGATSVVLRLINRNQPDKKDFPYKIRRFVALPPEGMPRVVDLGSKYRLIDYRDNVYHYPSADPSGPKTAIPADLNNFVKLRDLGRFRDYRLGSLEIDLMKRQEVLPHRFDHLLLDEATFALVYSKPVPPGDPIRLENWLERDFLRRLAVNPAMPPALDPADGMEDFAEVGPWIELLRRAAARGGVHKITVYEPGLHQFSGKELAASGLTLGRADARNFRFYYRGQEIPFQTTATGPVREDDFFVFFAPGEPGEFYTEAFWLCEDARPLAQEAPLRIEAPAPVAPGASVAVPYKGQLVQKRRWAQRLAYERKLRPDLGFSRWHWIEISMGQTSAVEFDLGDAVPGGETAKMTIDVAVPGRAARLIVRFYVNGLLAGDEEINRAENRRLSLSVPSIYFQKGANQFAVSVEGADPGVSSDRVLLKGFELEASFAPSGAPASGTFELRPATAAEGALLPGPEAWAALSWRWDVSNPLRPKALAAAEDSPGALLLDAGVKRIALASPETARPVGAIERRPAPSVADRSKGGNYVIVHHGSLAEGARRLAERRGRERGVLPRLLDVEEMFDAFDYGRPGSEALAKGLRYAYRFWPDPKPFYVVLVGEASEWKGDPASVPPGTMPDLVPVYNIENASENILRGDHRYGLLRDGDKFPSLVMSRIPVSEPEQLAGVLKKIERYETEVEAGPWQLLNIFVADDEPEFSAAARHVVAYALNEDARSFTLDQSEFPYRSLAKVRGAKQAPAATDLLVEMFNKGALSVNFFGHGGPNIWTHERLFHLNDLERLHNIGKPPLVTCSSCDNAWLDYPLPPVSASMGERLAIMPEGGAIGVFAPTAGGFTAEHQILIESLYEGIYHRDLRRVGDATFHARLSYIEATGKTNITDQFVLLGDPATRLALPDFVGQLQFDPPFLNAAEGGVVKFRGSLGEPVWGWADVALLDDETGKLLQTARARLRSGVFAGEITLPAHALDGQINGLALAYNPSKGFARLLRGSFIMAEPKLRWEEPLRIHEVEVHEDLSALSFPLTVTNPLPIPVDRAQIRISRAGIDRPIFERRFRFEPGESKPIGFRWTAAPGAYAIRVDLETGDHPSQKRSYDMTLLAYNPDKPADYVVSEATLDFRPQIMSPGRLPSASVALFNAGGAAAPVQIGGKAKPLKLKARLVHAETGEVISHDFYFEPPAGGRFADLRLVAKQPVEEYKTPIAVSVAEIANAQGELGREIKRLPLPIGWARGADLSVGARSVRFVSEAYREGQTIFVEGVVENVGDLHSEEFEATAYLDEPWNAATEVSSFTPRPRPKYAPLAPGEKREISVRWDSFNKRGDQEVYLVANPRQESFEQTFANNVARSTAIIKPHPDFVFQGEAAVSPLAVSEGTEVRVRATVFNDSDEPVEALPVRARLIAELDPSVEPAVADAEIALEPNASGEVSFVLTAKRFHNLVELELNPGQNLFEREASNNIARARLAAPLEADDLLAVPGKAGLSYRMAARLGRGDEASVRPDGSIAPSLANLYATRYIPFSPEQVERYLQPEATGLPADRDNLWTLQSGLMEASPQENAEAIRLAIPAGTERLGLHVVRARVASVAKRSNAPATRFEARIEDESDFALFDFAPRGRSSASARGRDAWEELGVYDLQDGVFDAEIDDVRGAWTTIYGFEFAPALAVYEAPPVALESLRQRFGGAEGRIRLRAIADQPAGSVIRFQRRVGSLDGRGGVSWGEWQDDPSALTDAGGEPFALSGAGDLLAWRAELRRNSQNHPVVQDVRIEAAE